MNGKWVRWLHGEVKSPPMSEAARREIGYRLRELQQGIRLGLPHSRPMPGIGPHCHELRVTDATAEWRLIYRIDPLAILVLDVFGKKTRQTPQAVMENCRRRIQAYERDNP